MSTHAVFDLVLFGGTGDLALRKLLPSLYYSHREARDTSGWRIIAASRQPLSREDYLELITRACRQFIPAADFVESDWQAFTERLEYVSVEAHEDAGFAEMALRLRDSAARVRVFFMSTASALFAPICTRLKDHGLVTPLSRVVLEKPLGRDLPSSQRINADVGQVFEERQIFRIDHYLGKETVQNLMALRFGNSIFEPIWNRSGVRDVQITLAENIGVRGRGDYYDKSGALRDMVQNHLLQLLCIVAMEPPSSIDADAVRDEKLKVLRALRPFTPETVRTKVVRGQYRAGAISGEAVPGYLDEPGISPHTHTETFVAIKAELDNWRWSGVPFYLRTGKRMQERMAEIVVNFRPVPHAILPGAPGGEGNRLVIQLQPDEGVKLFVLAKVPGEQMQVKPVALNLDFSEAFKARKWDAYERLLMDVIAGKLTLFMRRDELESAWTWIDPIQSAWAAQNEAPKTYAAGTWGPTAASALIARDGLSWREEG